MSQQRQYQMVGGNNAAGLQLGDTTYTKIFVGGLAWETQRETMRRYFEQFGEIQEAVVITDKNTGRSKGYGFVTFKDPDAAIRACQDPSPVIDGRRANCNLASLGAQHRTRPPIPKHGRFRAGASGGIGSSSTTHFHQHQYAFPPSAYGYSGYSQESMYPMNYYSAYGGVGGQQFSPYFTTAAASAPQGIYPSLYPLYVQYPQNSQTQGYGVQHPQMAVQYPYLPHHFNSTGIISLTTAVAVASPQPSNSAGVGGGIGSAGSQTGGATGTTTTEQSS